MAIKLNNINMIDSDTRYVYSGDLYMLSRVIDIPSMGNAYILLDTLSSDKLNHLRLINIASDADINYIQLYEVPSFTYNQVDTMPIENLNRLSSKTSDVIGRLVTTGQGFSQALVDFRALNNGYISQPVYEGEMILKNSNYYVFLITNQDSMDRKYVLNVVFYQTLN